MQALLGADYPPFAAALTTPPPVSIRLNPAKPMAEQPITDGDVPWHPSGRYLSERPVFTLDPAFHAGAYYVQEASSMFLYAALRQTVDFSKNLRVLDLCAAPGGKSTLLADLLGPDSLLVANELKLGGRKNQHRNFFSQSFAGFYAEFARSALRGTAAHTADLREPEAIDQLPPVRYPLTRLSPPDRPANTPG